jgi:hypothetical protein
MTQGGYLMKNTGCLTLCGSIQFLFERGEHLQREGLAFFPYINQLLDFFLQTQKQSKWGVHTGRKMMCTVDGLVWEQQIGSQSHANIATLQVPELKYMGVPFDHGEQIGLCRSSVRVVVPLLYEHQQRMFHLVQNCL